MKYEYTHSTIKLQFPIAVDLHNSEAESDEHNIIIHVLGWDGGRRNRQMSKAIT